MAKRAGIQRIGDGTYNHIRNDITHFVDQIINRAILYTQSNGTKTVDFASVDAALKSHGITVYGFGSSQQ